MARLVLIVEDDPAILRALLRGLSRVMPSERILSASSVDEARGHVRALNPGDVIWVHSDYDLPGENGLVFLRELPAQLGERLGARVLATGGNLDLQPIVESEGIIFIAKPWDSSSLIAAIAGYANGL